VYCSLTSTVLKIAGAIFNPFFPIAIQRVVAVMTTVVFCAVSEGRTTNRECNLHGRKILVTVQALLFLPFLTDPSLGRVHPLGLTLLKSLVEAYRSMKHPPKQN